jgi:hypothetical protein
LSRAACIQPAIRNVVTRINQHHTFASHRLPHDQNVKALTRDQLQSRKEKAVRFTRDVVGDPDRADEIEGESLENYAERRKIKLNNPRSRKIMATLKEQLEDLENVMSEAQSVLEEAYRPEATREELAEAVGAALDIISGEDSDESDEDDDEDEDEDEGDAEGE